MFDLIAFSEGGSPVVAQICSIVGGGNDDNDVEHQIDHPSVEYLNNGVTIQVYEVPPETDNPSIDIKTVEDDDHAGKTDYRQFLTCLMRIEANT